ncbi:MULTISPECIES: YfdQ family protein [unclassified Sphingobium]|uniref:YfdQ family protein n=1 Tax=unclassified Sphingobium TaxID=2611147 RepID=UPI0022259486|nr:MULTISPECIES: YfdQ family protein [unclassified Sphingobium]MCW2395865.1 hypothetical protein [Sphingobium sp. B8D3B]MCW2419381.1 hypothetical protein [Sphingobium sp. B8D3C]
MENRTEIDAARELVEAYGPVDIIQITDPLTGITVPASKGRDGIEIISPGAFAGYRKGPVHREGSAAFTRIESLIEHIERFKDADSALFAIDNRAAPSITAVLDYHPAGATSLPRFGKHRAVFNFPLSDEWKAWAECDKKPMTMADFAAFLEDRIVDVIELIPGEDKPSEGLQKFINICGGKIATPTKLVELSRGLKVYESANVREAVNLSTGEAKIAFEVEHQDEHGGKLDVPNLFMIAIPVLQRGMLYRLAARLRYRKTPQGLVFFYELWRSDRAFDDAISEACERVHVETGLPLLFGKPE